MSTNLQENAFAAMLAGRLHDLTSTIADLREVIDWFAINWPPGLPRPGFGFDANPTRLLLSVQCIDEATIDAAKAALQTDSDTITDKSKRYTDGSVYRHIERRWGTVTVSAWQILYDPTRDNTGSAS